jgi:hypothetical protein
MVENELSLKGYRSSDDYIEIKQKEMIFYFKCGNILDG